MSGSNGRATALLVIDLQKSVLAEQGTWDPDGVVERTAGLVDRARSSAVPVVWVQHSSDELERGSAGWQLPDALAPAPGESVVHKRYGDAFEDTDLGDVLTRSGVGHLVVAGAQTDACIRASVHGALVRGYDVTLVSDCHTTGEFPAEYSGGEPISARTKINLTNSYVHYDSEYKGRAGTTKPAAEIEF